MLGGKQEGMAVPIVIEIKDGTGLLLVTETCEPTDEGVAQSALARIQDHMIRQVIRSGTTDIESPLTISWHTVDTEKT
jgi:hypothetical protein